MLYRWTTLIQAANDEEGVVDWWVGVLGLQRGNIQICFQAGMLQMKLLSPQFAQIPTIRQLAAKKPQPEMEICNRK